MVGIDPRRIPVVGRAIYNVGQVIEIIDQPCTPDPIILVKAFFVNIPYLVWSFVKPDPVDYLTERFGSGHHRRRKRKLTEDDIDIEKPSGNGHARWAAFSGVSLLQKAGWYFTVVDGTADFLINWTSMAYRYSGCQDALSGYATTIRTTPLELNTTGAPQGMVGGVPKFTPGYNANGSVVQNLFPGTRIITANVTFGTPTSQPQATIQRVFVRAFQGPFHYDLEMDVTGPGANGQQSASMASRGYNSFEAPTIYNLYVQASISGFFRVESWQMQLSGFTRPGIEPDP